ncbi:MAG: hypothetical protein R2832_02975 [Rhodothermales bacterium]
MRRVYRKTGAHGAPARWLAGIVVVLVFAAVPNARAQGLVRGTVHLGSASGPAAAGATVIIAGTLFGGLTDADGRFELGPLPPGDYELRVVVNDFGEVSRLLSIGSAGVDLSVVVRRADLALVEPDAELRARLGPVAYAGRPGTVLDRWRSFTAVDMGRAGWGGTRPVGLLPVGPVHPFRVVDTSTGSVAGVLPISGLFLPISRGTAVDVSTAEQIIGVSNPQETDAGHNGLLSAGFRSNGRLRQIDASAWGHEGRMRYRLQASAIGAGGYHDGAGSENENAIEQFGGSGELSLRLTPYSDVVAVVGGTLLRSAVAQGAFRVDGSNAGRGFVGYRLRRPDAFISRVMVGASGEQLLDRASVDLSLPGSLRSRLKRVDLSAEVSHVVSGSSTGTLSTTLSRLSLPRTDRVDAGSEDNLTIDRSATSYRLTASLRPVTISALASYEFIRSSPVVSTGFVSAQLGFSAALSAPISASLMLSSTSGIEAVSSPRRFFTVGQLLTPLVLGYRPSRVNAVEGSLSRSTARSTVSVTASIAELSGYLSISDAEETPVAVFDSGGLGAFVAVEAFLQQSPFLDLQGSAHWSYGEDGSGRRLVGLVSPQIALVPTLHTPGGAVYIRPEFNVIAGLPAAGPGFETPTSSALWIDLAIGFRIRSISWAIGSTNLNDATFRYHTSLFNPDASSMNEPGRSYFVRATRHF